MSHYHIVGSKSYISIDKIKIFNNNILLYKLSYSKNLEKYFSSNKFYVKYDNKLKSISDDLLYIPGVGCIITLCWATGSDLYIDELDSNYINSLEKVKDKLNVLYPGINLYGEIYVKIESYDKSLFKRKGLLFSGGVDSTSLFIKNRKIKPDLISIIGGIIPTDNRRFINNFKEVYKKFAKREGVNIFFIETNIRDVINETLLTRETRKFIGYATWWGGVSHGLVQLSLCAPLTMEGIGQLNIASSVPDIGRWRPFGSDPRLDSLINWREIRVIHEGAENTRQGKIKQYIKKYVQETGIYPKLQVCNYNPVISKDFNCGFCEKCVRTILGLLMENIDPRKCSLTMTKNIFDHIKKDILPRTSYMASREDWKELPQHINLKKIKNYHGSKRFFSWLKEYRFKDRDINRSNIKTKYISTIINSKLPKPIEKKILKTSYRISLKKLLNP
jgi:hypothetical protein